MAPLFTGKAFGFGRAEDAAAGAGGGGSATGGFIIPSSESGNGWNYHVFLNPNSDDFVISGPINADILLVAGGGGGAVSYYAGGGGAGGVVYGEAVPLSAGTYSITVGAFGPNGGDNATPAHGLRGGDSLFAYPGGGTVVTAEGGGAGAGGAQPYAPYAGQGGSAGGNHGYSNNATWITKLPQPVPADFIAYGNPGAPGAPYAGGGGGGSYLGPQGVGNPVVFHGPPATYYYGGPGGWAQPFAAFPGPIIAPAIPETTHNHLPYAVSPSYANLPERQAFINAVTTNGYYGAGGGGGLYYTRTDPTTPGGRPAGGPGGGGDGAGPNPGTPALRGVNHTGAGGGGGNYGAASIGRPGGNGIVIVRYQ